MAGYIEKRINGDGSVTWRCVVPLSYGRHAPVVVRTVRAAAVGVDRRAAHDASP